MDKDLGDFSIFQALEELEFIPSPSPPHPYKTNNTQEQAGSF